MKQVIAAIENAFAPKRMPSKEELVRFDGFDGPAKEYLLKYLHGKTRDEVLRELRGGTLGTGAMLTEEMEVAEPAGIRYYLKPFLIHLAERMRDDARALDDELPFFLFTHIRNIVERRGRGTFTESQLRAIAALVDESLNRLASMSEGIWIDDVSTQARALAKVLPQ
jgi:hypothetical protein